LLFAISLIAGFPPSSAQLPVFLAQVRLACAHGVPLFVHTRLAHEDTLSVLAKAKAEFSSLPPVLVHCFTGTEAEVRDYLELGFYIGVTGFVNKAYGAEVKDILSRRIIPLDRLCIEVRGQEEQSKAKSLISSYTLNILATRHMCNPSVVALPVA
jgi:Tat protein secretion system quality control protein TatD with DNase activity